MEKVTQVSATVDNVPGKLAALTKALADADVNIEGMCCTETGKQATWHFVVDKVDAAKKALSGAGKDVVTHEILIYHCPADKPGVIAALAKACADADVNIRNVYIATPGRGKIATVYLWVDDGQLDAAMEACEGI